MGWDENVSASSYEAMVPDIWRYTDPGCFNGLSL